jgi:Rrf2 family transcriptional regulator, iron-sulfur cluster assembly transcription factor
MFSKACEYALRSVLYISIKTNPLSRLSIAQIAKEIDAPLPYTAKILQTLVREGIISSMKGPNGGFFIHEKAKDISLSSIVKAIDGSEEVLLMCTLGLKECSDKFPCPIHHEVKNYKDHLKKLLNTTTIQQLSGDLAKGKTFLKKGNSKVKLR